MESAVTLWLMFRQNPWKLTRLTAPPRAGWLTLLSTGNTLSQPKAPSLYKLVRPLASFQVLLLAVLVTCVFLLVPHSVHDPDIWWHLRNAAQQLHTHSFLRQDIYSFTAVHARWIDHEWLAELPFYLGWRFLGGQGLYLVTVCVVECIFAGVFLVAYRRCHNAGAAVFITVLAACFSTVSFGPRTLLFGWLGLTAELLLLQDFASGELRAQKRMVRAMPLLFLLWVNVHGSWLIGMVILLAFLLCGLVRLQSGSVHNIPWTPGQRRTLILTISLSVASLFVNPYGWELVLYPFDLAFHQKLNIASVEEWQSLNFHTPRAHLFLLCLLFAACLQVLRLRRWTVFDLALVGLGVYAALTYSRFLFLAAILILPLLASDVAALRRPYPAYPRPRLNAILTLAILCVALHRLHSLAQTRLQEKATYPEAALTYLQNLHPQSNVFNNYLWGGYLEWYVPSIPVLIDSRVDIFERRGVLKDYLDAMRLHDTLGILDTYKIGYVLFPPDTPLVYLLRQTHRWRITYLDRTTIVLKRCVQAEACVDV